MIVGFMRNPTQEGYLGYTYGGTATVVCESEPDLMATVVHEIAHCYIIGDEYRGGSLNDGLNPPPYGMEGHDIITREPAVGTKENVVGGSAVGLRGTGSVIYPQQRAYWVGGRELLGTVTSYMGGGTGEDSFMFWTSSDIYNHIFKVFTGQMLEDPVDDDTTGSGGSDSQGEFWGQCFQCYGDVYDPPLFIECSTCGEDIHITGDEFSCGECGTVYSIDTLTVEDLWLFHEACGYLLYLPAFQEYNSSGSNKTSGDEIVVLEIVGDIDPNGAFYPEPWFSYEATPAALTANREGEYSAAVYDAAGKRLSVAYFNAVDNAQITTREGIEETEGTEIPIRVTVKFPESAARVVILKGDKEIYSRDLSANAPVVAFTGLSEGQSISNNITLTWEGSDADGDELTYQVWYYRNDEEQFLVAGGLTGTSYKADLTDYPGTDQGWFKILATDGLRTGTAESPKVSVPYKAPDILNYIPDGTEFKVTDLIEIQGKVYDAQDGWLWNEGYEWYVDGRLYENYGNFYFWHAPYMLAPGPHTITMKATNSAGITSSMDFNIEILADESDLPDDWPRSDITLALRLGFYQPLDRLESPITRIEYAKMMFSLYSLALPDDLPDDWIMPGANIMCEFSDMSNDMNDMDYVYATMVVALGIMEPKNATYDVYEELDFTMAYGEFDPHGALTQREAMQIMYNTIELSRTQTYTEYTTMDESEFIPQLKEFGMIDDAGSFNAYAADEKFSKGLTMVRLARFVKYEFEMEDKDYGLDAGFFDNFYKD